MDGGKSGGNYEQQVQRRQRMGQGRVAAAVAWRKHGSADCAEGQRCTAVILDGHGLIDL